MQSKCGNLGTLMKCGTEQALELYRVAQKKKTSPLPFPWEGGRFFYFLVLRIAPSYRMGYPVGGCNTENFSFRVDVRCFV